MKSLQVYAISLLLLVASVATAQPMLWSETISETNMDFNGNTKVIKQVTLNTSTSGKAIVQFNGVCHADEGDRIVLAASDDMDWDVDDGNIGIEALSASVSGQSFSHTRAYDIGAGSHTFYAVGQNYVETDGNGFASVYGMLTVRFFPDGQDAEAEQVGIAQGGNFRGSPVTVDQVTINAAIAGQVVVRFDGACIVDVGDRIVLAASDDQNWHVNDGNVAVEADNNDVNAKPFCHTRKYTVGPGSHTFYAVAENYVETGGSGNASIYGSLTAEFFPGSLDAQVVHTGMTEVNINLRGNPVVLDQVALIITVDGKALITFDGECESDIGDRIVLAASDDMDWDTDDGNVGIEAVDSDANRNGFSHSRVYNVSAGTHTYYAIGENYVNTSGSGEATIYGNLTAEFYPDQGTGFKEKEAHLLAVYPNPASDFIRVDWDGRTNPDMQVQLLDATGRLLQTTSTLNGEYVQLDCSEYAPGVYIVRLQDDEGEYQTKVVLQ